MPEIIAAFLMQRYGFDAETALELISEMKDTHSLERLADYRVARGENTPLTKKFDG